MLLKPDCIPCILKVALSAIKKLRLDEDSVKALYAEILEIPALRGLFWDITPAEVIEDLWEKIIKKAGCPDPFDAEKLVQNKKAMALYPSLQKMAKAAADPLKLAVKLSILGNSMDLMMADPTLTIEKSLEERLKLPFSDENYLKFRRQLKTSQHVLIFDRLLIETIKRLYQPEIALVVRSVPTLNDATLKEAKSVGLDKIATVIENGIDGPLPGTFLSRCSPKVKELVRQSDLIISKGGGNFDTLDEEKKHLNKNISFLLLSKCEPYYQRFGIKLYQPILVNDYPNLSLFKHDI